LNTEIIAEIIRTELTNSDIKKIDDCFIFDATEKIEINKGISSGLKKGMWLSNNNGQCQIQITEVLSTKSIGRKKEFCSCKKGQTISTNGNFLIVTFCSDNSERVKYE
jgi:hypothetical protein